MAISGAPLSAVQQVNSLAYDVPEGWNRAVDPNTGVVTLVPRGLPFGGICAVSVFTAEPFSGSAAAFHDEIVRRGTAASRLMEPPQKGATGGFLVTGVHQVMSNGLELWNFIYTARWSDRGQALMLSTNTADLAQKYLPVADAMVSRIAVPQVIAGPSAPAPEPSSAGVAPVPVATAAPPCLRPNGIELCPKPVLSAAEAVPIVGAYISAGPQTSFSVDPRDPGVKSRVTTTILLLFGNGVAVRASAMGKNIDDNYWAEGFATLDPRDPSQIGARAMGHWTESGGKISINWQIGLPTALTRDGTNLMEEYNRWTPYAPIDGLRLDGRYQRVVPFGPPWEITLHRDGRFTSSGLNNTMGGATINPGFPEQGSGSYEIMRWSLVLRFSTGFVQSINLMLGQGDPANPQDLVLNGHDYVRSP